MARLITFTSSHFNGSAETPNPSNPIAGESVLNWLRETLVTNGYAASAALPEDWGWYMDVSRGPDTYLVGASSDVDQSDPREWIVQIHKARSLMDKLRGRNKLADDDPLCACIESAIRANEAMSNVRVDKEA